MTGAAGQEATPLADLFTSCTGENVKAQTLKHITLVTRRKKTLKLEYRKEKQMGNTKYPWVTAFKPTFSSNTQSLIRFWRNFGPFSSVCLCFWCWFWVVSTSFELDAPGSGGRRPRDHSSFSKSSHDALHTCNTAALILSRPFPPEHNTIPS